MRPHDSAACEIEDALRIAERPVMISRWPLPEMALGRLETRQAHSLAPKQLRMIDLRLQMDRIVAAAQEFIPKELHEAFLARVEGRPIHTRKTEAASPDIREFSPSTPKDEDDI